MRCEACGKEVFDNGEERFACPYCGAEIVAIECACTGINVANVEILPLPIPISNWELAIFNKMFARAVVGTGIISRRGAE